MTTPKCDFCDKDARATWRYPAQDVKLVIGGSEGDWAACDECHALLEKNDRKGLLNRALAIMMLKPEVRADLPGSWAVAEAILRVGLEHIHGAFWRSRLPGEVTPVALDNAADGEHRTEIFKPKPG